MIIPIIFLGNNSSKLFLNSLFLNFEKSRKILLSKISSFKAGFKSILSFIFFSLNNSSIFLYLTKWADALKTTGPEIPK